MPVPTHIFDPPFNIIRSSHAVLDVTNLETSRAFYENIIGLHAEDHDDNAVYLRGSEEHQHHSLVLRKAVVPGCARLGFKVGADNKLVRRYASTDKAEPPKDEGQVPWYWIRPQRVLAAGAGHILDHHLLAERLGKTDRQDAARALYSALGAIEVLSVAYLASSYRDAFVFGVMILILLFRPQGLFGVGRVDR